MCFEVRDRSGMPSVRHSIVRGSRTAEDGLDLARHHLFHAVRADLLRRLDRPAEAAEAYDAAIALTGNEAERAFLRRRRTGLRN